MTGQQALAGRDGLLTLAGAGGLLLAAGLLVWATQRGQVTPPLGALAAIPPTPSISPSRVSLLLLGFASLLVLATVPGFLALAHRNGVGADVLAANEPWLGWLVALGLCLLASVADRARSAPTFSSAHENSTPSAAAVTSTSPASRFHLLVLLAILVVAAILRLWALDVVPRGFWVDEAVAGEYAKHILADALFRPVYLGGGNGEPAFYLYGLAGLIAWLGPTVEAVRLATALLGVAGVVALYWFARPLWGVRVALVGAALLAVMTWHLNFSRIAFNSIWSIPVDLVAAGCLFRGLATGRRGWYILAGLGFGLGFHLYYISRAWLVLIALVVMVRLLSERGLWTRARGGLVWAGLALLLAAAPVLSYAVAEPADYAARAAQVSLFSAMSDAHSLEPLVRSLTRYALMFNVQGDFNGRHNLPDAPMLDSFTAALLPLGLALALFWTLRRRAAPDTHAAPGLLPSRWPYLLLVFSPVLLLGGLLSAPDDSPQALRTLGVTVAVALLAALPVVWLWDRLDAAGWGRGATRRWLTPGAGFALILLVVVGGANIQRYFGQQAPNAGVWDKFATAQRLIGEEVNTHQADSDTYVVSGLHGHPTIQFLTGGPGGALFTAPYELPLPPPSAPGRGALLFLDRRNGQAVPAIQAFYPNATVQAPLAPGGGDPVMFAIRIPAADLAAPLAPGIGLRGSYWPGASSDGPPAFTRLDPTPSWWYWYEPIKGGNAPFTVVWEGLLLVPEAGRYTFAVKAVGQSEIWLDGQQVLRLDTPVPQMNEIRGNVAVPLPVGPHPVRLVIHALGWLAPVYWYWTPPGGAPTIIPAAAFRPPVP